MKKQELLVVHKTDEVELIVRRLVFPGKNTGWLGVGSCGNVWLINGNAAYWICDIVAEGYTVKDKKKIVLLAKHVMQTDGSMETAFNRAISGVKERDFRCGYRIVRSVGKETW